MKNSKLNVQLTLDLKDQVQLKQFYIFQKTFSGEVKFPVFHAIKRFGVKK